MKSFTYLEIYNTFKRKGYIINEGILELNIFGIRNSDVNANTFDDLIGVLYKGINGEWNIVQYPATTDPGEYYRLNPMNSDGTAILIPKQFRKVYKFGKHTGYPALEQIAPMEYVRDANRNKVLDFLYKNIGFKVFKELAKTNIHKAGKNSKLVDKWSAGCQVLANEDDFEELLTVVKDSLANGKPNEFDYTLFQIEDFK